MMKLLRSYPAFASDAKQVLDALKKNGYSSVEEESIYREDVLDAIKSEIKKGNTAQADQFLQIANPGIHLYKFKHKDGTQCYALASSSLSLLESLNQIKGLGCK